MPQLANPFLAQVPRKMSKEELAQAIRQDLVGELEAIFLYEGHVQATDDKVAKKILEDIGNEEKEHVGELLALLQYLDPAEADFYASGVGEVAEMLQGLKVKSKAAKAIMDAVVLTADEGEGSK